MPACCHQRLVQHIPFLHNKITFTAHPQDISPQSLHKTLKLLGSAFSQHIRFANGELNTAKMVNITDKIKEYGHVMIEGEIGILT